MNTSISYKFFMEFFRFTKTGFNLASLMKNVIDDEIECHKAIILMNLIISQNKFDEKLISENIYTFDNLLGFMTGMIDGHLQFYQEQFITVMEHAEKAVSMGLLTEQQYLSSCNTFKMLSNEATNLKRILNFAEPASFSVESENIIRLKLNLLNQDEEEEESEEEEEEEESEEEEEEEESEEEEEEEEEEEVCEDCNETIKGHKIEIITEIERIKLIKEFYRLEKMSPKAMIELNKKYEYPIDNYTNEEIRDIILEILNYNMDNYEE